MQIFQICEKKQTSENQDHLVSSGQPCMGLTWSLGEQVELQCDQPDQNFFNLLCLMT